MIWDDNPKKIPLSVVTHFRQQRSHLALYATEPTAGRSRTEETKNSRKTATTVVCDDERLAVSRIVPLCVHD